MTLRTLAYSCRSSRKNYVGAISGFTLVELLVTIAVIALLIGILAPAIGSAREAGRRAVCASNLRQVQIANELFAEDHDDRRVPGAIDLFGSNLHRWHGTRTTITVPFDPRHGDITPYLDSSGPSRAIRACPSFVHTLDDLQDRGLGFEAGAGGYGYNNAFVGVERRLNKYGRWVVEHNTFGAKRSKFASPSATIGFADAALAGKELIEYSFVEPRKRPEQPRFRPDPTFHFRHGHLANVVWLDGHVGSERMTFTRASGAYPTDPKELRIGWFGVHDDNRLFDYE